MKPLPFFVPGISLILGFFLVPAGAGVLDSSRDYQVAAGNQSVFVASASVLKGGPVSFSSFDFTGTVHVTVTPSRPFKTFKILPASLHIQATVSGQQISFVLNHPANLTLELNGNINRPLHLFANPPEENRPDPKDPNVIYFGPGLHEVSTLQLRSNQCIYLAEGSILRAVISPDEKPELQKNRKGDVDKIYTPLIQAEGADHIRIRGRGILDLSSLSWHARKAIWLENSSDILLEGFTILDAPDWGIGLQQCRDAVIRNIKQISWRENGDGIDISNSQDVLVENCFIRSNDDAICVKTLSPPPAPESKNIVVRNCVIWSERARALGITSETRSDISNVLFENCDILHDFSQDEDCAALAILVSDSGMISNIRFKNIRIEDCRNKLIRCWIGEDGWAQDQVRGRIKNVVFQDIIVTGNTLPKLELLGYDPLHSVEDVTFDHLKINGQGLNQPGSSKLETNSQVRNIRVLDAKAEK